MSKDLSNLVKRFGSLIPGFSGYENKESLRSSDYQIRLFVKRNLEKLIREIERRKSELNDEDVLEVDKTLKDLKVFCNQISNQPFGYDALMDRKGNDILENIIENDKKMIDLIESINYQNIDYLALNDTYQQLYELLLIRMEIIK